MKATACDRLVAHLVGQGRAVKTWTEHQVVHVLQGAVRLRVYLSLV